MMTEEFCSSETIHTGTPGSYRFSLEEKDRTANCKESQWQWIDDARVKDSKCAQ
jgi:hypothetical protein